MEVNEIIKEKLKVIGEDIDFIKPFMMDYLNTIESIISKKSTNQKDALQTLRENSFSVSSISKELGCSRTTFYNHNQLLKRYIEQSEALLNQENPFIAYEDLKASKSKLEEQINLMEDRDITMEILKQENIKLLERLKDNSKETLRLHTRVNKLSSELHQIKVTGNSNSASKVTSINKK